MADPRENYRRLSELAFSSGAALFGVADISLLKKDFLLPESLTASLTGGISCAVRLARPVLDEIEDHPTKLYFHHYRQANQFLDQLAFRISSFIHQSGFTALPIPASQIVDWQTQKGHLSHKKIARAAGIGWLGRNNLLVTKHFGSQVRLVTVLTDFPLPFDRPTEDSCRDCRSCIPFCPARAITESARDFDPIACFNQLKDFQKKGHVAQYVCGICVKACSGGRH